MSRWKEPAAVGFPLPRDAPALRGRDGVDSCHLKMLRLASDLVSLVFPSSFLSFPSIPPILSYLRWPAIRFRHVVLYRICSTSPFVTKSSQRTAKPTCGYYNL